MSTVSSRFLYLHFNNELFLEWCPSERCRTFHRLFGLTQTPSGGSKTRRHLQGHTEIRIRFTTSRASRRHQWRSPGVGSPLALPTGQCYHRHVFVLRHAIVDGNETSFVDPSMEPSNNPTNVPSNSEKRSINRRRLRGTSNVNHVSGSGEQFESSGARSFAQDPDSALFTVASSTTTVAFKRRLDGSPKTAFSGCRSR